MTKTIEKMAETKTATDNGRYADVTKTFVMDGEKTNKVRLALTAFRCFSNDVAYDMAERMLSNHEVREIDFTIEMMRGNETMMYILTYLKNHYAKRHIERYFESDDSLNRWRKQKTVKLMRLYYTAYKDYSLYLSVERLIKKDPNCFAAQLLKIVLY